MTKISIKIHILRVLAHWSDRALQPKDIIDALPAMWPLPTGNTVRRILTDLVRAGLVEREDKGWFAITAEGVQRARESQD